jgi:hypothetical protein
MGLLTKALEVTWSCPHELQEVVPCDGGMHLPMSIFAGIDHLYGDAGLQHLLHESGVYAPGSAQHILSGKDFDRALRALKLVDEALSCRFMHQFNQWRGERGMVIPDQFGQLLVKLDKSFSDEQPDVSVSDVIEEALPLLRDTVEPMLKQFREEGRALSPTFKFWDDFLQSVMLPLKMFVAATRNGNWEVYNAIKVEFLPLLFATNRNTDARYIPAILLSM